MSELSVQQKGYEFHHIGYATASSERERSLFEILEYQIEGESFVNALEGESDCCFVTIVHAWSFWETAGYRYADPHGSLPG